MSKESLSDSHLFSHIPMPKLKSTLAKCATFIYSTHKFIKYKINWWTETCGNFGHLLLTLVLAFSETSYTNENTFKSTQMYVIVILNFPELYLNMQLTTVFLCSLKANSVLIIDFWPYEICTCPYQICGQRNIVRFENYGKNASLTVLKKFWDSNRTCRLNDDSFCHCRTSRCFVWHEWHFNKTTCKASCSLTKQQLNMTVQRLR